MNQILNSLGEIDTELKLDDLVNLHKKKVSDLVDKRKNPELLYQICTIQF